MAASGKTDENRLDGPRVAFLSGRLLIIGLLLIVVLLGVAFIAFRPRGSDVERGTQALFKAFSKQRLIEPRLSGGLKWGKFNPEGLSGIDSDEFERAHGLIADAVSNNESGAELAYGRLLLSKSEKLNDAKRYLGRAVALSHDSAEAHNDLGVCLIQLGRIEDAIDRFEAALKTRPEMPEALFNRALCYQQLFLKDAAQADLSRLASIERDSAWLKEIEQRLEIVSARTATQQASSKVIEEFESAVSSSSVDEARKLTDQNSEAMLRYAVWSVTIRQLKAAVAGDQMGAKQALSELDLIGSVLSETRGNSLIADIAKYLRYLPESEKRAELDLVTAYADTVTKFQTGQAVDPLKSFQSLQKRFQERGNHVFEALSAFQSANYYYSVKRFSESIRLLKDVLALVEQHKWPFNRASVLNLLALQTSRLGQDSLAIKYFEQAFSLCDKSPQLESQILQYMSIPYWRLGDLDKALARLRDSTRLYLENGPQPRLLANLAHNYSQMADIYRLRDNHALSLLYAREALAYSTQADEMKYAAEYSSFIALEHARLNQLDKAEAELAEAIGYLNRLGPGRERDFTETLVLINAGEVAVRSGDVPRALGYYNNAKSLTERGEGNTLATIDVLRGRATAYATLGQNDKAHSDLMSAVGLIEEYWGQIAASDQRSHFLDASHNVFDQLINLDSTSLAQSTRAFELSERARARALLEEIGRDKRTNPGSKANSKGSPKANVLSLSEVQSYLDGDSMILEYAVTSRGTFLFLITHTDLKLVRLEATTEILDRLVRDYISDLRRAAPEVELNEKAAQLYDYLIKPVKEEISRKSKLFIVPDKALHFLPFVGLVDRSSNTYLIDSQSSMLTYAPSASVLARCLSKERLSKSSRPEKILAVGNPRLNTEYLSSLSPLIDAETEARQSATVYAPGSVVLVGEQATETNVRRSIAVCDVAHLALHCVVEESSPWLAALVLADAKPAPGSPHTASESAPVQPADAARVGSARVTTLLPHEPALDATDGLLYLNELYDIRLPLTKLVVLSACQSGLGQYYRGEGIVSLVRPLLAAGVPTVVASLWQVDSLATSDLMIEFHSQRKLAKKPLGEALHNAQLKVRRSDRFSHPYYWAPFIMIGASN